MNLFQTSPVIMSLVDWRISQRNIAQKGGIDKDITQTRGAIDTDITETKEEGATTRELMRDVGSPIVSFMLGRFSKSDSNKNNKNNSANSNKGGDAPNKTSEAYELKSREWDEAIKRNSRPQDLKTIQKSLSERINDAAESFTKSQGIRSLEPGLVSLGVGSSLLPMTNIPLFML